MMLSEKEFRASIRNISPSDYIQAVASQQAVKEILKPHKLDDAMMDRALICPFVSVHGNNGYANRFKTVRDAHEGMRLDSFSTSRFNEIRAYRNSICDGYSDAVGLRFKFVDHLFSGVSGGLPMPTICFRQSATSIEGIQCTFIMPHAAMFELDENLVSFSPKNLMKHYGYPERDAKQLFKNVRSSVMFDQLVDKFYIPKKGVEPYIHPILIASMAGGFSERVSMKPWGMWSFTDLFDCDFYNNFELRDFDELLEFTRHDVPDLPIRLWKDIAKEQFISDGVNWDDLSVGDQKRRLVNFIRHNSIGYTQSWAGCTNQSKMKQLHDISFERINKQIAKRYPFLATEAIHQIDKRDIPLEPKNTKNG